MKKFFTLILLLLGAYHLTQAQIIIDISTGVGTNNQLLPVSGAVQSFDDDWMVSAAQQPGGVSPPAIPTVFNPVPIGTGNQEPSGCMSNKPYSSPHEPGGSVRWLSPYLNSNGEHTSSGPVGLHWYKFDFTYTPCANDQVCQSSPNVPRRVFIKLDYIGFADNIVCIMINNNNNSIPINPPGSWNLYGTSFVPQQGIDTLSNRVLELSPADLLPGQNTLYICIVNISCCYQGLEIKGSLHIDMATVNDASGEHKSTFCVGEDMFLSGGEKCSQYSLELSKIVNGQAQSLNTKLMNGAPYWVNITELFTAAMNDPNLFLPGAYRVRLQYVTECDTRELIQDFTYQCCGDVDPSFSLNTSENNSWFEGKSNYGGQHQWEIYKAPSINTGPYTRIGSSLPGKNFRIEHVSDCYYVKHTITTACGTACTGQRFCGYGTNCDARACNLSQPPDVQLNYYSDLGIWKATWGQVPGAVYYQVETTLNSPHCCSTDLAPQTQINSVNDTKYEIGFPAQQGFPGSPPCFAIRVFAVCADGSLSQASDYLCSSGQPAHRQSFPGNPISSLSKAPELDLFPNPSQGMVSIQASSDDLSAIEISIFDNTGRQLETWRSGESKSGSYSGSWDAAKFGKGIYLVKARWSSSGKIITKRLIIQ
jgi:hypothetical protein